ncbi:hypothetical protein FOL47_007564 [Perkinsus chesapeaki]|uniref:glutathione-specific gamma-glutamylcyclotransferase n=1 Tax=Perkinsus chesapeaki TaxID=330153 RepID=A0A7J6LKE8_PERCH|nr:hypothetical protein FOL47_007564 [Perkinsus chesapeaki]
MGYSDTNYVFAYASLMWDGPSMAGIVRTIPATLKGYSREMCIKSYVYRGTRENPGLCMGLKHSPGGHCDGMVLEMDREQMKDTLRRIDQRELVMGAYTREEVVVRTVDGQELLCYTYVVNEAADNYTGEISEDEKIRLICTGVGQKGPSIDYLVNLVMQLEEMGLDPGHLAPLLRRCREKLARGPAH